MRLEIQEFSFGELVHAPYPNPKLPLFSAMLSMARSAHNFSVDDMAAYLGLDPEVIYGLERGEIWPNINRIRLDAVENMLELRRNSLMHYLRQDLVI